MARDARVEALFGHLSSLELGPSGDAAAARELAALEPVEAAHALRVLLERAKGSAAGGRVLALASRALMFSPPTDLPYEHRGRIHDAAVEQGMSDVAALFTTAAAAKLDESVPPPDPVWGQVSLGHKKMLARQTDPDKLARLAAEGDARVIREVLLNPRLTEGALVRVVARRPAKAEVLMEVWRSPKWSVRPGIRKALALNPYTPPDIALKILPHLVVADLKQIAGDRMLAASVRQSARELLSKRHPRRA